MSKFWGKIGFPISPELSLGYMEVSLVFFGPLLIYFPGWNESEVCL